MNLYSNEEVFFQLYDAILNTVDNYGLDAKKKKQTKPLNPAQINGITENTDSAYITGT